MTTREDILERLAYADALGHGPRTSALVAEAVSWADALGAVSYTHLTLPTSDLV